MINRGCNIDYEPFGSGGRVWMFEARPPIHHMYAIMIKCFLKKRPRIETIKLPKSLIYIVEGKYQGYYIDVNRTLPIILWLRPTTNSDRKAEVREFYKDVLKPNTSIIRVFNRASGNMMILLSEAKTLKDRPTHHYCLYELENQ